LIYTKTGRQSSFNVQGWSLLFSASWSPGKDGLFVSAFRGHDLFLLRVGFNGETHVLLHEATDLGLWALPSPDSRLLALREWRASKNVWMIDNF
jgi:hypothetical protein